MTLYAVTKVGFFFSLFNFGIILKRVYALESDTWICILAAPYYVWSFGYITLSLFASGSSSIKWRFYRKIGMNTEY